ncbi:hypothetical protein [Leifsonia xyli]|jgi:hypothetical protein|uniref:hypothetical protein n=1 Tax=Leifsonia xyli TaxID=1575 RepID=UPI0003F9057D|nr:hypothetical protein [Leifsonia xyli]
MSPVEPNRRQSAIIQREIDADRRWERRLSLYALMAFAVLAAIIVVRVVFFS